jgi:hypothetical protein
LICCKINDDLDLLFVPEILESAQNLRSPSSAALRFAGAFGCPPLSAAPYQFRNLQNRWCTIWTIEYSTEITRRSLDNLLRNGSGTLEGANGEKFTILSNHRAHTDQAQQLGGEQREVSKKTNLEKLRDQLLDLAKQADEFNDDLGDLFSTSNPRRMIKIDGQPAVLVEYRVNEGRFYFVPQEGTQRQTYSAPQPELLLGHLKMLMRIRAATQETIARQANPREHSQEVVEAIMTKDSFETQQDLEAPLRVIADAAQKAVSDELQNESHELDQYKERFKIYFKAASLELDRKEQEGERIYRDALLRARVSSISGVAAPNPDRAIVNKLCNALTSPPLAHTAFDKIIKSFELADPTQKRPETNLHQRALLRRSRKAGLD